MFLPYFFQKNLFFEGASFSSFCRSDSFELFQGLATSFGRRIYHLLPATQNAQCGYTAKTY